MTSVKPGQSFFDKIDPNKLWKPDSKSVGPSTSTTSISIKPVSSDAASSVSSVVPAPEANNKTTTENNPQASTSFSNHIIGAKKKRTKKCESDSDTDSEADFAEAIEVEDYGELDPTEVDVKQQLEADLIINESESDIKHRTAEQHLEIQSKIVSLNHEHQQSLTRQATREARKSWGTEFEKLAENQQQLFLSALKNSSQNQYDSNKNRVLKAGFKWNTQGLYRYFTSAKVAETVGNSSCYSIVSTFKFFYAIEHNGSKLPENEENLLRLTLRARKNRIPDVPRIVGAIGKEKLVQLHALYDALLLTGKLSPNDHTELVDFTTMLYAGALRIFQGRSLTATSITFNERNNEIAWIDVPSKSHAQNRFTESKTLSPSFIQKVRDIVNRRKAANHTLLFPLWAKAENDASDAGRLRLENLLKDLNQQAANLYCWPAAISFHGTHNFRHGAAMDAFEEGGVQLTMLRTGHISQGCAEHYARSELERLRKCAFANMTSSAKLSDINKFLEEARAKVLKVRETADLSHLRITTPTASMPLPNLIAQSENDFRLVLENRQQNSTKIQENFRRRRRAATPPKKAPAITHYSGPPPPEYLTWPIDDTKTVTLQDESGRRFPFSVPKPFIVRNNELFSMVYKRLKDFYEDHRQAKMPTPPVNYALLDTRHI